MKNKIGLLLMILCFTSTLFAQMSRKPTAMREPDGAMAKKPDTDKRFLAKIDSLKDFNKIARVYHQGTPYAMPHTMFIIDRRTKNKIYFVNSQKYRFHKDFLLANYLIARGSDVFTPIYINQDRRFIVGTIAWQKTVEKFTFELYEGETHGGKPASRWHVCRFLESCRPNACGF